MAKEVIILGAGGHSKVVIDMLRKDKQYSIMGIIDTSKEKEFMGFPILGDDTHLEKLFQEGVRYAFVAVGSNKVRKKLSDQLKSIGYILIKVVSENAILSEYSQIGSGSVIMPGAIINACATIGDGCIINTGATVDHDTFIGEYTHIAPGTHISGSSKIGKSCFLGVGTNVVDSISIGDNVMVGAGSTVIRDLKSDCTVVGTPAKVIKWND